MFKIILIGFWLLVTACTTQPPTQAANDVVLTQTKPITQAPAPSPEPQVTVDSFMKDGSCKPFPKQKRREAHGLPERKYPDGEAMLRYMGRTPSTENQFERQRIEADKATALNATFCDEFLAPYPEYDFTAKQFVFRLLACGESSTELYRDQLNPHGVYLFLDNDLPRRFSVEQAKAETFERELKPKFAESRPEGRCEIKSRWVPVRVVYRVRKPMSVNTNIYSGTVGYVVDVLAWDAPTLDPYLGGAKKLATAEVNK